MDFVVEDGTGIVDATTYVSLAFAVTYFGRVGMTAWAAFEESKQQELLNQASEYVDIRWSSKLPGHIVKAGQGLELPQSRLYTKAGDLVEGIPTKWQKAVCEYAIQASKGTLWPKASNPLGAIKSKKVKAGPVETATVYQDSTFSGSFGTHLKADGLIKSAVQFTNISSNNSMVIR